MSQLRLSPFHADDNPDQWTIRAMENANSGFDRAADEARYDREFSVAEARHQRNLKAGKVAYANSDHYVSMPGEQRTLQINPSKGGARIYQAGLNTTRDHRYWGKANCVINVCEYTVGAPWEPLLNLVMDDYKACPSSFFDNAVAFHSQNRRRTWVNCFYGKNRSSAICMAILMGAHGYSLERALTKVRRRPFDCHMTALYNWAKNRGLAIGEVDLS